MSNSIVLRASRIKIYSIYDHSHRVIKQSEGICSVVSEHWDLSLYIVVLGPVIGKNMLIDLKKTFDS